MDPRMEQNGRRSPRIAFHWYACLAGTTSSFFLPNQNTKGTLIVALLYGILAVFTLLQALQGKPLFAASPKKMDLKK